MSILTPAQAAQQSNRTDDGKYTHKTTTEAEVTLLGPGTGATEVIEDSVDPEPEPEIRYSFLEEFQVLEEQFNTDFDGIPNRFFNADLRGKFLRDPIALTGSEDFDDIADALDDPDSRVGRYFNQSELAGRLCHAVSTPEDNRATDEDVEAMLLEMDNVSEVHNISEDRYLVDAYSRRSTRAWLAKINTTDADGNKIERNLLVTDGSHNKLQRSQIKVNRGEIKSYQSIVQTDVRSLIGAARLEEKLGYNIINDQARVSRGFSTGDYPEVERPVSSTERYGEIDAMAKGEYRVSQARTLRALQTVEAEQLRGRNFLAQKKYVRAQGKTIATAFDDKKHPDKVHAELMDNTTLAASNGGKFGKVEIDNDVNPEEFADFTAAVHQAEAKLPTIPGHRRPDLRIRKLGKHRARGLYSASHNAVAIDVNTSEAFIHEMGHYYDMAVKNSASLSSEFSQISRDYARDLREPDPKRNAYYNTPTEQFARGFEMYAHERLGINNRLVRPEKFNNNDYAPFQDEAKKARLFAFFDKTFAQT